MLCGESSTIGVGNRHDYLRCFRRFVGRRGPTQMVSCNDKTFIAASKTIQDVKWTFNVPKAPWWGGVFERLVRSVKRCLKKMLGLARLTYDELFTALVEVEMVLNSQPLTVVSAEDLEEPLTPSHLIVGHRLCNAQITKRFKWTLMLLPNELHILTRPLANSGRGGGMNI